MATTVVGIRPGEKIHESMITAEDSRNTIDIGAYYVIKPEVCRYKGLKGEPVPEGFAYNSDTNSQWLTMEAIRATLREQGFAVPQE
jgi:UDP-N-acetylglucosamine 4,6-dehydratase